MATDNIRKIYTGQDIKIPFKCFRSDGVTTIDLSDPGRVELTLSRRGLMPFLIELTSEDPGAVQWTSRSTGEGIMTVPIVGMTLPAGLCRLLFTCIDRYGEEDVQEMSWVKIIRTEVN